MKSTIYLLFLLLLISATSCAKKNTGVQIESDDKPYVILVSLDGFRYDYVERFQPPNLTQFIAQGVQAESMISSYPSKTFPNHYTIATGLLPEKHGLVANTFFDPDKGEMYQIGDREAVEDGSWYGGAPLWVNAEQNGMTAASYFFVGSEAAVQGVRPSYYFRYDGGVPNQDRVNQALRWLQLPINERPHLITMYFSDMDDTGHRVGPNDDDALRESLMALDKVLGRLFDGAAASGLPVNIILVSDHGMQGVSADDMIPSESIENEDLYVLANNGALAFAYVKEGVVEKTAYDYLKERENNFRVYRTEEFPYFQANKKNKRLGDLIILPDQPYYFKPLRTIGMARDTGKETGEHGFPPEQREMHAIFYAQGPAFKSGLQIPSFHNIHVYPLVCKILGLPVPEGIDGDLEVLKPVLED